MGLRAVVFDYGMVLSGVPDVEAHDAMVRLTGLPADRFETLYWADRHAYDEGKLSGVAYWQKFLKSAGLPQSEAMVDDLNQYDARMWTTQNPAMVAWQLRLKERGILTAILSNMGDTVLENLERSFDWINRFDVTVWSYQLLMAKPEPAIYRYVLKELGTQPEETLFIDDRLVNIEAAAALGMPTIQFTSVERLRADLIAQGLDKELPLPE